MPDLSKAVVMARHCIECGGVLRDGEEGDICIECLTESTEGG